MKPIEKVSVVGLGTLGTQIAIQAAAYGYAVCGFDPEPSAFAKMHTKVRGAMQMTRRGPTFPIAQWEEHVRKVQVYDDLARAIGAADLVHRFQNSNYIKRRCRVYRTKYGRQDVG